MRFSLWLRNGERFAPAARRRTQTSVRQRPIFRPRLEAVEDRCLLSGYQQINLVGYQPGIGHFTDPNLNGWGMASMPDGSFVVATGPILGPVGEGPRRAQIGTTRSPVWTIGRLGLLLLALIVLPWPPICGPPSVELPARRVRGAGNAPIRAFAFAPDGATIATIQGTSARRRRERTCKATPAVARRADDVQGLNLDFSQCISVGCLSRRIYIFGSTTYATF